MNIKKWVVSFLNLTIMAIDIGLISFFATKVDLCGNQLIIWLYGQCILHGGRALCSGQIPNALPPSNLHLTQISPFLDCCVFCVQALLYPGTILGWILEIIWIIYGMFLIHYARSCASTFPLLYSMLCVGTVILLGLKVNGVWNPFPPQENTPLLSPRPQYTILGYEIPFLPRVATTESCSICLEPFKEQVDIVRILSCRHIFHTACIDSWLTAHSLCPLCRHQVRIPISL